MLKNKIRFVPSGLIIIFLISGVFLLNSFCSDTESNSGSSSPIKLVGKVLTYAPEIDITSCEALAQCDCCAGNYLFINDREFISIDYCEADVIYSKGTYNIRDSVVTLNFDSLVIDSRIDWSLESDPNVTAEKKYIISERKTAPSTIRLTLLNCEKNLLFDTGINETPFAALDKNYILSELVDRMKSDGIWGKLKLK